MVFAEGSGFTISMIFASETPAHCAIPEAPLMHSAFLR